MSPPVTAGLRQVTAGCRQPQFTTMSTPGWPPSCVSYRLDILLHRADISHPGKAPKSLPDHIRSPPVLQLCCTGRVFGWTVFVCRTEGHRQVSTRSSLVNAGSPTGHRKSLPGHRPSCEYATQGAYSVTRVADSSPLGRRRLPLGGRRIIAKSWSGHCQVAAGHRQVPAD